MDLGWDMRRGPGLILLDLWGGRVWSDIIKYAEIWSTTAWYAEVWSRCCRIFHGDLTGLVLILLGMHSSTAD